MKRNEKNNDIYLLYLIICGGIYLWLDNIWYTLLSVAIIDIIVMRVKVNELKKALSKKNQKITGLENKIRDIAAQNIVRNLRSPNREKLKNGMGYGSADFATKGNWYRGYETDPNDEK